jgi:hypothetical protein
MNNASSNGRWALAGPLAVILWIVGLILVTKNQPGDHASGSQILAWYSSHQATIALGALVFMVGCLSFVTFAAGLRVRLAEATGADSLLPGLALVGAAMAAVAGMLTVATDLGGAINNDAIAPATAATLHNSIDVFFVCAELALILPIGAVAVACWKTRILPRWWAAASGILAVVLVIGPIGWVAMIFGLPVWTLGTSLFVLLRSQARMHPAAATA